MMSKHIVGAVLVAFVGFSYISCKQRTANTSETAKATDGIHTFPSDKKADWKMVDGLAMATERFSSNKSVVGATFSTTFLDALKHSAVIVKPENNCFMWVKNTTKDVGLQLIGKHCDGPEPTYPSVADNDSSVMGYNSIREDLSDAERSSVAATLSFDGIATLALQYSGPRAHLNLYYGKTPVGTASASWATLDGNAVRKYFAVKNISLFFMVPVIESLCTGRFVNSCALTVDPSTGAITNISLLH